MADEEGDEVWSLFGDDEAESSSGAARPKVEIPRYPTDLSDEDKAIMSLFGTDEDVEFQGNGDGGVVDDEEETRFSQCFLVFTEGNEFGVAFPSLERCSSSTKSLIGKTGHAIRVAKCMRRGRTTDYHRVQYSSVLAIGTDGKWYAWANHAIPQVPKDVLDGPLTYACYSQLLREMALLSKDDLAEKLKLYGAAADVVRTVLSFVETGPAHDVRRRRKQLEEEVRNYVNSFKTRMESKRTSTMQKAECLIVHTAPSTEQTFEFAKTRAIPKEDWAEIHLQQQAKRSNEETFEPMKDPYTDEPWLDEYNKSMESDICIVGCSGPPHGVTSEFLLPVSLSYLPGYTPETKVPCAMIGFPMIDETRKIYQSEDLLACDNYKKHCRKYEYRLRTQCEKALLGKPTEEWRMRKILVEQINSYMGSCFQSLRTGNMVCSTGNIVRNNGRSLAATYTSLPGSSGGAVFVPDLPEGTFVGIHAGGANFHQSMDAYLIWPNYNIATSCDNPTWVLDYVRRVLPTLPLHTLEGPRMLAFCHFLMKHIKLIARELKCWSQRDVSKWLPWLLHNREPIGFDATSTADISTMLLKLSAELLRVAENSRNDFPAVPTTSQELDSELKVGKHRDVFFAQIKSQIESAGISIEPWGLPVRIKKINMLRFLAEQLG